MSAGTDADQRLALVEPFRTIDVEVVQVLVRVLLGLSALVGVDVVVAERGIVLIVHVQRFVIIADDVRGGDRPVGVDDVLAVPFGETDVVVDQEAPAEDLAPCRDREPLPGACPDRLLRIHDGDLECIFPVEPEVLVRIRGIDEVASDDVGSVLVLDAEHLLQERGERAVVTIQEPDELPSGPVEAGVPGYAEGAVGLLYDDDVVGGVLLGYVHGPVGGPAIDDKNDLEVLTGLLPKVSDDTIDVIRTVQHRDDDADLRNRASHGWYNALLLIKQVGSRRDGISLNHPPHAPHIGKHTVPRDTIPPNRVI